MVMPWSVPLDSPWLDVMSVCCFHPRRYRGWRLAFLGVKGPAGPAATEAFRDLQTTPADSHLQQPHPACVTALCIAMAAQIPAPFCLEGFSAGSYTGALLAVLLHRLWEPGLRSGELGVDEMETDDPAPIRSTVALGALGMPDWVFQPSWGHLTASFCYITTGTPCALGPLTW